MRRRKEWVMGLMLGSLILLYGVEEQAYGATTPPPTIDLPKAVHFQTPSGDDVVVGPGTFVVEAVEQGLRLTPKDGRPEDSKMIQAEVLPLAVPVPESGVAPPSQPIEGPKVLSHEIGDDALLIALLRDDGTGLEAIGSFSGVRSRAACSTDFAPHCVRGDYTTPPGGGRILAPPDQSYISGVVTFEVDPGKHRDYDAWEKTRLPFGERVPNPFAIKKVEIRGYGEVLCVATTAPYRCSWDSIRRPSVRNGDFAYVMAVIYDNGGSVYRTPQGYLLNLRNYYLTVTAGDGAVWGLLILEANVHPSALGTGPAGEISQTYRNHRPVKGVALGKAGLRVVRGQVQIIGPLDGEWYAWNGSRWVQPVLQPIPSPTAPPVAPPTVVQPPPPTPPLGQPLITASFTSSADGFVYQDDAFRGTTQPAYANGTYLATGGFSSGGLQVELGGQDYQTILGMSGGWTRTFTLAAPKTLTLSFRYNLTQTSEYDPDEVSQVLVSLDGTLVGRAPNDYVAQVVGDGNGGASTTTGWQLVTLTIPNVAAGQHQLRLGGYNNKKTAADETTTVLLDDVLLQ